jgi:hypothetical protein
MVIVESPMMSKVKEINKQLEATSNPVVRRKLEGGLLAIRNEWIREAIGWMLGDLENLNPNDDNDRKKRDETNDMIILLQSFYQ